MGEEFIIATIISCLIWGVVWGIATKHVNESKGYYGGFWWGFWLGFIGMIVVACKPTARQLDNDRHYSGNEEKQEKIFLDEGHQYSARDFWKCPNCGVHNANYVTGCGCGYSKFK